MTARPLRSLTAMGVDRFREVLVARRMGAHLPPIDTDDTELSREVVPRALIDPEMRFENKFDLGRYLCAVLTPLRGQAELDRNEGIWSWIVLLYIDQFCPAERKPLEEWHYIPVFDNKRHRHLARTPYEIYELHREGAREVLHLEVHQHGEWSEQLLSRVELYRNTRIMRTVVGLYGQDREGVFTLKRGALGSRGGSLRRFMKVYRQFDLTYDLQGMSPDNLLSIMPKEFDRFRSSDR